MWRKQSPRPVRDMHECRLDIVEDAVSPAGAGKRGFERGGGGGRECSGVFEVCIYGTLVWTVDRLWLKSNNLESSNGIC